MAAHVNVVDYRAGETEQGNTYTATLWFIAEKGDDVRVELSKGTLRTKWAKSGSGVLYDSDPGSAQRAIPFWSTVFTGNICDEKYDDLDEDAILTDVEFGDITYDEETGLCYREVEIKWGPYAIAAGGGRPKNNTSDNPADWFPEWRQSIAQVERDGRMIFRGYMERKDFSKPIGDVKFKPAGNRDTRILPDEFVVPQNSAGQLLDPPIKPTLFVRSHEITEYLTLINHPFGSPQPDLEVVNNRDLLVQIGVFGYSVGQFPVTLFWEKHTAKITGQRIESALYTYKHPTTDVTTRVPYFVRTTTVSVSNDGWNVEALNAGHMYMDEDGKLHHQRLEDGMARVPVGLDRLGNKLEPGVLPGAMVYGPPASPFNYFGTTVGNTITVL